MRSRILNFSGLAALFLGQQAKLQEKQVLSDAAL